MIEYAVVPSSMPHPATPAQVAREFAGLLRDGARLETAGSARRRPGLLLRGGYAPRARIDLFDTTFYVAAPRQNEDIRFFVAYVRQGRRIHPRIFYKDVSLTWRSASHYVRTANEVWIGKGDVQVGRADGLEWVESDEGTTDLPLEIQSALEELLRRAKRIPHDQKAVGLVLRRASEGRIRAYGDFTGPRRRAAADPKNLPNRGRPIARFTRKNDPTSLRFAAGFEPDFAKGVIEEARARSSLYGGPLRRLRIASKNGRVQFLFIAGPRQVWIASCQTTSTELSSYGVRTVDAQAPDDLLVPGYEYHFMEEDEDPPVLFSQIPPGFAGEMSPVDDSRVDASPWIDRMPVIREFRRSVLRRR